MMAGCYAVCHKQLGDVLLLEPSLAKLRAHHGSPVRVMTRSGHRALLELMPGVVHQRGLSLRPHSSLYCYDELKKSTLRSFVAPACRKHVIVPPSKARRWFHHAVFGALRPPELDAHYVAEHYWDNTPVPSTEAFRMPQLTMPPDSWRLEEVAEGPYILISATSGWAKKMWTVEGWLQVIPVLQERFGKRVVLTSGSADWQKEHCEVIAARAGEGVQNLSSQTSLRQFLWLCSRATTVLSVDGAASHLAQAFGKPTLTLFGPTSKENWHKASARSVAVQAELSAKGRRPMRNLSPQTVLKAMDHLFTANAL